MGVRSATAKVSKLLRGDPKGADWGHTASRQEAQEAQALYGQPDPDLTQGGAWWRAEGEVWGGHTPEGASARQQAAQYHAWLTAHQDHPEIRPEMIRDVEELLADTAPDKELEAG